MTTFNYDSHAEAVAAAEGMRKAYPKSRFSVEGCSVVALPGLIDRILRKIGM